MIDKLWLDEETYFDFRIPEAPEFEWDDVEIWLERPGFSQCVFQEEYFYVVLTAVKFVVDQFRRGALPADPNGNYFAERFVSYCLSDAEDAKEKTDELCLYSLFMWRNTGVWLSSTPEGNALIEFSYIDPFEDSPICCTLYSFCVDREKFLCWFDSLFALKDKLVRMFEERYAVKWREREGFLVPYQEEESTD